MTPCFKIGDQFWIARVGSHVEHWETCPDCLGKKCWHLTMPCGEELDVACPTCYPGGYDLSTGFVRVYDRYVPSAPLATVTGVRQSRDGNGFEYETNQGTIQESDAWFSEEDAMEAAKARAEKALEDEIKGEVERWHRKSRRTKPLGANRSTRDGSPEVEPVDDVPKSVAYARSQVRKAAEEARSWIAYGAQCGAELKWPEVKS